MKPSIVLSGDKALTAISKGVNAVYEVVKNTFGPKGSNALLFRAWNRGARITNDGVTVSGCITPKNPHIRLVAEVFKEAAKKTNERVGDGTTLTTILGGSLFNKVFPDISEKTQLTSTNSVVQVKNDILEAAKTVKEKILEKATKIETLEDLEKVAIVSVEDEELGKLIAKMAWEVGVDGFIDVVEGYKGEIETEIIKGMRFPAKVPAKAFVNNPDRYEMVAQDSSVLVTNYALDNMGDIGKMLQDIGKTTSKLIILAPSFSENVLLNFHQACKQGYYIYPVKTPSLRTEQFEDISIYCGATFIDKATGKRLKNVAPHDLGKLEKLVVKDSEAKEDAMALGGIGGEEITLRINTLKSQLEETRQIQFKKLLERRIASMASAVGVIKVGDSTEASSLYRKLKIEDAVYACKAALRKGYVKGGGLCLKEIAEELPKNILTKTLKVPYEQIMSSGVEEIGENVIDPAEALYYGIEHATQVVANLITVESIIQEDEVLADIEGLKEIAKWEREKVITQKIKEGQLKEGEAEAYRDGLGGLTEDEYIYLNED